MTRDLNVDQIKKLWILDLIIQSGSLKKAALLAKVSPSAISQTLSSLETSVGRTLLVRERGNVTPTQDALAILDIVRPAFEAFDRLRDINNAPTPKISWLNFGTYESIAIDILPGLMHSLKQKMPHLRLGLRISRTANLLTMVRKGELCSALITEVDDINRLSIRDVAEDRLGFYVSNRHPILQLGWQALDKYGVGSLAPGKEGLPRYYRRFIKQVDHVKPVLLSDSFEALRAAAASGALVSVLPRRVALRLNDLCEITPPGGGAKGKSKTENGLHRIYLVSQSSCDPEEFEFLAEETGHLLNIH